MPKVRRKFVILFAIITSLDLTQQACIKSCNNNGFCYVQNGIEKCKCLDRIYVGESCEKLVNHCDKNSCSNGGKCIPDEGQYNCLCAKDFYGQNCTSKEKLFGQVYLQYNHIAPVSSNDNYFLIILTDLGIVESMVEMVTAEYAIAGGLTFPSGSGDFQQTNNVRAIAKELNVPVSPSVPTGTVYFHAGKYRMPAPGIAVVTLTITDFNSNLYYVWYFQFGSRKNVGCNPLIEIRNCGAPTGPISMNVRQPIFVEANVRREDCGRDSNISFNWSITNYFDTKTLQSFNVTSRSLKLPPFSFRISYNNDVFSRLNLIKLVSLEKSADGTRSGEALNRCYIYVLTDNPIAKIAGGVLQQYSNKQTIFMDGSDSVDMSVHPKRNQNLAYAWRCSMPNNNSTDEYCTNLNESGTFLQPVSFILCFIMYVWCLDSHY